MGNSQLRTAVVLFLQLAALTAFAGASKSFAATSPTLPDDIAKRVGGGLGGISLPGSNWDLNSLNINQLSSAYRSLRNQAGISNLLKDSHRALLVTQEVASDDWQSVKFQDYYQGLEVLGSMAIHHRGPFMQEEVSDLLAHFNLDTHATLSTADAIGIARGLTNAESESELQLDEVPVLKILPSDEGDSARLVYRVVMNGTLRVPGHTVTLDAQTGEVLSDTSHWLTFNQVLPRKVAARVGKAKVSVFQTNKGCQQVDHNGSPVYLKIEACDQTILRNAPTLSADADAKRALSNATRTLSYYLGTHGRDSFDAKGTDIRELVHVGENYSNAFWDTQNKIMGYGDGDGVEYKSFTLGVDVAGHEMTHGVVSATANLDHEGEYGALNEALADYFGKMIAGDGHWEIGKSLNVDPDASSIRNLANPGLIKYTRANADGVRVTKPYPSKLSEKMVVAGSCNGTNDYCGVHINSTIFSHGLYNVTMAIGKARAEKIIYLALTQNMTSRTNFKAASAAVSKACLQLYPTERATTCAKVKTSLAAVEL